MELLCRSLGCMWGNDAEATHEATAAAVAAAVSETSLQAAWDASLAHLSAYCNSLVDSGRGGGGGGAEGFVPLLAQRAFGELAAAVSTAEARGLTCARAQTLMLHLLKVS